MTRWNLVFGLAALFAASPASAADLYRPVPMGRFVATCEDLGHFCLAQACGRDQIAAAEGCRAQCRSAVVMTVRPTACPLPVPPNGMILRSRG
ncbi:hypothetical protein [Methylobacterium komagatae]